MYKSKKKKRKQVVNSKIHIQIDKENQIVEEDFTAEIYPTVTENKIDGYTPKLPLNNFDKFRCIYLMQKYKLSRSLVGFCKEANINDKELKQMNKDSGNYLVDASLPDGITRHPRVYDDAFQRLLYFYEELQNPAKQEIYDLINPVFAQMFSKLVDRGFTDFAMNMLKRYSKFMVCLCDLHLLSVESPEDLPNHAYLRNMKTYKIHIILSYKTLALLNAHIKLNKEVEIIVLKYIHFEVCRLKDQNVPDFCKTVQPLTNNFVNKMTIYTGLLDSSIFLSLKKELVTAKGRNLLADIKANAPTADRFPITPTHALEKINEKKLLSFQNRKRLFKDTFPDGVFYFISHSHNIITCVDITEDLTLLAVGLMNNTIKVFTFKSNDVVNPQNFQNLHNDQRYIKKDILLTKEADETCHILTGHNMTIFRCNFSPCQLNMLSCSTDTTIRLWCTNTWSCLVVYKGHYAPVWDVCFSPHGQYFASSSYDTSVHVWSIDDTKPLRILSGHLSDVNCVQFHPNSNYIATGSSDANVLLWDVTDGKIVRVLKGHKYPITALTFSPCGRHLVTLSKDNAVLVWDLSKGLLITVLNKHNTHILSMAISHDNKVLVLNNNDESFQYWNFSALIDDYKAHTAKYAKNQNLEYKYQHCESNKTKYLLRTVKKSMPLMLIKITHGNVIYGVGFTKQTT